MNKPFVIFIAIVFASLEIFSCKQGHSETEKQTSVQTIETINASRQKLTSELNLPAEITGFKQVDVYAKVSSYVKQLNVDIGSEVRQGQLLMLLEAPEISSQLTAAHSRLLSLEAIYISSENTYKRLLETGKTEGTISKNELDLALAKKNSDYAQWQAGKAAYKEVQTMQQYLEIRAPFDGVVTSRNVNIGAYVGPAGRGSENPLLIVQQHNKLRLTVFVPETYSTYLTIGDELSYQVKSLPGETFTGRISRMARSLDGRLRSERVELDINNSTHKLLPGMIAEVTLKLTPKDSACVIPKTALVSSAEGTFVLLVDSGVTKRTFVQRGREINQQVEIFGKFDMAKLVKNASEEIKDGTPVNRK